MTLPQYIFDRYEQIKAATPRERSADFAPLLHDTGVRVEWVPPDASMCRGLGFVKVVNEAMNDHYREALIESAWQALEIERITGKPPP